MKNFRDYLKESEEAADNPVAGDNFAINIREECLIESVVIESRRDGVVIAADERMMQLLESYGYTFEENCMECGMSESDCGCSHEQVDEIAPVLGAIARTAVPMAVSAAMSSDDETNETRDPGEYDYEGDMAKNELYTMIRSARKLIGMLDNDDNMPEWTQKKINKATDYVDTASDYISSQKERGVMEQSQEDSPVARATLHRIMMRHPGMLAQHGPERVMQAVDDVADLVGDMDDIGTSDVSGWVNMVQEILDSLDQGVAEGSASGKFKLYGVRWNSKKTVPFGTFPTIDDVNTKVEELDELELVHMDNAKLAYNELHLLDTQTGQIFKYTDDGVNQAWEPIQKNQGVAEGSGQSLSVQQLATISDAALDQAYGYGRSTPGNSFGWQANLMSAAYAKKLIDAGVTDIEKISDAIHKGWNVTAQKFVQNPEQFDDTEKLRQAGKLDAKLQQRAKLMKINYAQLDNEEQEKDRVVARALLQAIKGQQGAAEGSLHEDLQADDGEHYRSADDFFGQFEADHFDDEQVSPDGMEIRGYIDGVNVMAWRFNSPRKTSGYGVYDDSQLSEAEYQGRKVPLGKPMKGDVAKSKVYVKDPKTGNVKKVNFGDPNMKIKKSNPARRKSFRARHNCDNPGPRTKARYWSCRAW